MAWLKQMYPEMILDSDIDLEFADVYWLLANFFVDFV